MKVYVTMAVTHVWEYSKGSGSELKGSVDERKGSVGELKGSVGDRDEGALCRVVLGKQRRALRVRAREPFIGSEGAVPRGGLCRGALSERADPRGVSLKGPCPEWEDPRGPHQGWRTEGAFPREPVRESRADGAVSMGHFRGSGAEGAAPRGPCRSLTSAVGLSGVAA